MNVLITGGAGFIGYHLAYELLNSGYEITLVDNFERGVEDSFLIKLIEQPGVQWKSLDLLCKESFDELSHDYDMIFHLAAIIGVQNVLNKPDIVLKNNMELLFNVIEFAKKQQKLHRLLFTSTSEVYAGTLQHFEMQIPTSEATPLAITSLSHPRTSYMLSKIYGEAVLHQSELPFTIVRPHNFYGPRMGMSHVIPELLKKVYVQEGSNQLNVSSPYHKRTFCYITDAVKMIRLLAENPNSINEVYNVGNEAPEVFIKEVADIVIDIVGKECEIIECDTNIGSPERRCPDMNKTNECIKYSGQVSLREGISYTYDWYRKNIFEGNEKGAK